MTGFNHGMNGAVIALIVKQPALAIPLSFLSHYVADAIPHYGPELAKVLKLRYNIFVAADFVFSLILMGVLALLFPDRMWLIWGCMIAAAIPDAIWWFYRKSVRDWPRGLDKFTHAHLKINVRMHVRHFYFDVVWFVLMAAIIAVRYQSITNSPK